MAPVRELDLLGVVPAVGPLGGLEAAGGVALEVLPQAGAGGETLSTGLAPIRFVPGVDPAVIHQVPLRPECFATLLTSERSLPCVLPHVHLQIKLLDKALPTFRTEVTFLIFDTNVSVQLVGLQLTLGHKTATT